LKADAYAVDIHRKSQRMIRKSVQRFSEKIICKARI